MSDCWCVCMHAIVVRYATRCIRLQMHLGVYHGRCVSSSALSTVPPSSSMALYISYMVCVCPMSVCLPWMLRVFVQLARPPDRSIDCLTELRVGRPTGCPTGRLTGWPIGLHGCVSVCMSCSMDAGSMHVCMHAGMTARMNVFLCSRL